MVGSLCIRGVELLQIRPEKVLFRKGNGKTLEHFDAKVLDVTLSNTQYIDWNREKDELDVEFRDAVICEYAYPSKVYCGPKKAFEPSSPDYERR